MCVPQLMCAHCQSNTATGSGTLVCRQPRADGQEAASHSPHRLSSAHGAQEAERTGEHCIHGKDDNVAKANSYIYMLLVM